MEQRAPAAVTRNRLDHVFRDLTGATAEVAVGAGGGGGGAAARRSEVST
jgi:hypothetical protein